MKHHSRGKRQGVRGKSCAAIFWVLAVLLAVASALPAQTFSPLGYWEFSSANPLGDSSGNPILFPISVNTSAFNPGSANPIVGNFYRGLDLPNGRPAVSFHLDSSSANVEVGLEFWFRVRPGARKGSVDWPGKCQLFIGDQYIEWYVLNAGGGDTLIIPLRGIGAADPYHLLDGGWHHLVAQYSARTGEQRVYVDGICPPGFHVNHGPGSRIRDGGDLYFTYAGGVDHLVADIDEFAAYDTVIPPQLVWEHYQAGLAGQHYNFTVQSPVATYPFPGPVQEGEINLMEFAPGYPTVPLSAASLFGTYPLPRYIPHPQVRRLVPWMSDDPPFFDGSSATQSNVGARAILEGLAREWNYYLFCGGTLMGYNYLTNPGQFGQPDHYMFHAYLSMNDPANANLPRFIVSNWGQASDSLLLPNRRGGAAILRQAMPSNFYVRDWAGIPVQDGFNFLRKNLAMAANPADPRMDSIDLDGLVNRMFFDTLLSQVSSKHVEMVGENDEAIGIMDPAYIRQDWEIRLDSATNFPGIVSQEYQSERITAIRKRYRDKWLNRLDTLNAAANRPRTELMWYDVAGEVGYGRQRAITRYGDGFKRGSLHVYPQTPWLWRHGQGSRMGMDQTCIAVRQQLLAGDRLFNPPVSPGFNDGTYDWRTQDKEMLRPGQFLGMLKALACLGADTYAIFMYQAGSLSLSEGNWRTWQMPMLSYAQAVTSRMQRYLTQGQVLTGDTTHTYSGGWQSTAYTFSTGNPNDLITARKLGQFPRYLISASAQRTDNQQSQAPKEKVVAFQFRNNGGPALYDTLRIRERLQGSTYLLDRGNPAAPVFYQLDKWHEWKEPGHWCRDFDFEAEVWDTSALSPTVITERPVPANSGDFTEYTTFVRQVNGNGWTEYRFRPTGADQDTLFVWLHARNNTPFPVGVGVTMDGVNAQTIQVGNAQGFTWSGKDAGFAPVVYGPLAMSEHVLRVQTGTQVDLDRVLLLRHLPGDTAFWTPEAQIVTWDSVVCLGARASFSAKVGAAPGCFDHTWDFGDGTVSSGGTAALASNVGYSDINDTLGHLYQYPGDYRVVLSSTSTVLGETLSDTVFVHVGAPFVDAGRDTVACHGDSILLLGTALPLYNWIPDPALGSTTVLHPHAFADTSHYYYLHATDTSGCQMTDSAWVTVVNLPAIPQQDTVYICPGGSAQLVVHGAFWVEWDSLDGPLSDLHIPNPVATPSVTTTYHYTAIDVCRCDTIARAVTVFVQGTTTHDTTICMGGSAVLHAVGTGPFVWNPGPVTTMTDLVVSPTVSTGYFLEVDSTLHCNEVRVTVLPYACCSVPVPTDWVRVRTSTLGSNAFGGGIHQVFDTLFVDGNGSSTNVAFTGTTFLMQPNAVVYVLPGYTLTTNGCTFRAACPVMWSGIRLSAASSRWNSSGDVLNSAIRGVWSTGGGALDLNGSVFDGCWTGVFVEGGTSTHFRQIQGCKFLSNTSLLAPFQGQRQPWAGVHLENATSFVVGVAGAGWNRFDHLQHGVYCRQSRVAVYNSVFLNMVPGTSLPTVAPWSGFGTGMGAGVWSKTTGNGATLGLTVGHATATTSTALAPYANTFTSNRYGVYTQGAHTLRVRGNSFTKNTQGVRMGAATNSPLYVEYNKHQDDGTAIWVGNMPNNNTVYSYNITGRVAENTVTSGTASQCHGIRCDLLTYPPNATYPFQVYHNTVNVRGNAIWLQTSSRINVEDNRITLLPVPGDSITGITVNSANGNRVFNNQVRTNTLGLSSTRVTGIYVFASGQPVVICNYTFAIGRHVVFQGSCPGTFFRGNVMQSATGVLTAPAGVFGLVLQGSGFIGPQGALTSPSDNQWKGVFTTGQTASLSTPNAALSPLYSRAGATYLPTLNFALGGPAITFYPANSQSYFTCASINIPSSKLAAIQAIGNSTAPNTTTDSAMKYRADEWAYEAMLEDTAFVASNPSIQPYFNQLSSTDLGDATRANSELMEPDTLSAMMASAQLSPVTMILGHHKVVQAVRLDNDVVDSLELASLLAIAGQCEVLGGKGVNFARSMLAAEGIFVWNDPVCAPPQQPIRKQELAQTTASAELTAECWPNPNNGRLFLGFSRPEIEGRINAYDATGRNLLSTAFDYAGQPLEFDTAKWAQGLLLVEVSLKDGRKFSWRIVLER